MSECQSSVFACRAGGSYSNLFLFELECEKPSFSTFKCEDETVPKSTGIQVQYTSVMMVKMRTKTLGSFPQIQLAPHSLSHVLLRHSLVCQGDHNLHVVEREKS